MLAQHNAIFIGQAVAYPGTAQSVTFENVPDHQKLEFPVAENAQLGFCTGLAMAGLLPVCVYPRINFMLEALPQLIQHLDKIPLFSEFRPKVIIRTAVATDNPLDPGPQHLNDYSDAIDAMLDTVKVVKLKEAYQILPAYEKALKDDWSTILIEYSEKLLEEKK